MIEAMACGTPVLAFNRGSAAEIIEPGVTGFLVDTVEEATLAMTKLLSLDRRRVRSDSRKDFRPPEWPPIM
jgi:glycosyltransferase involved in cell wall biosynthesis